MSLLLPRIALRAPYDVARSINFWRCSTGELCEQWADGVYRRIIVIDGEMVVLSLHNAGTVDAPAVMTEIDHDSVSPAALTMIEPLTRQILGDDLDLGAFYQEAIAYLTRFRGIGRWTAEFILMRALGRGDALAANDAGVRQGIAALYSQRLSEPELRTFAERWGNWGGVAAMYLLAWLREEQQSRQRPQRKETPLRNSDGSEGISSTGLAD